MTPTVATATGTVTVSGTLVNHTGSALSGITVQAQTSFTSFVDPAQMTSFADGTAIPSLQQAGQSYLVPGSVRSGATVHWTVSFQPRDFYYAFGVFPVQVQAAAAGQTASARTFLPYWPGGASQTKGLQVAWVWPLIDTPQQGACAQTLATPRLAGEVASGGRLSTLLDAGSAYARQDDLTWEIDPALLSDVSVMTHPYATLGNAVCSGRFPQPASPAASKWLSQLKTSTAGEPAFLTPYADVDVAALSHSGLDSDVKSAYQVGETVAGQIMPGTFGTSGTGTGDGAVLRAAAPAGGIADAGVVTSLASAGGISTVVMSSSELPSGSIGEDALARTTSGTGTDVSLLLANSRITSLLGSASPTATAADQFALTQDYLAQTAMVAAELPGQARSLVVAPPAHWDPSPGEATALLAATSSAPWLHPASLSTLSAQARKLPSTRLPAKQVSQSELSESYLDNVQAAERSLSLFTSLLYQPPARVTTTLQAAVAAAESSAWRGAGSPGGWLAMTHLTDYLKDSERRVQIIASKKILLFGTSGKTAVSVRNGLGVPIQVQVQASTPRGSQLHIGSKGLLTVQAGQTNTVTMSVSSAAIGTTTVQLQLVARNGSPLAWTAQPLSVEVTRFGRSLLIIIGVALGLLVLTSAYRLHRKRRTRARSDDPDQAEETVNAGGAG